jgi:hypothetical protein
VVADAAPVAADVASVVADTVEAGTVEAVPTVVGIDRFLRNSKLSRPAAYAAGRFVW